MHPEPLDFVPLWGLLIIGAGVLWLVLDIGYRYGKWRHDHTPGERDQPVGAMVASILGLVALVIGFTFSLAASRFDARRLSLCANCHAIKSRKFDWTGKSPNPAENPETVDSEISV